MSKQFESQGCSPDKITLSMTRHDIANYLGLALETVSRLLTIFQHNGILSVMRRDITINNQKKLKSIANNCPESECAIEEIA